MSDRTLVSIVVIFLDVERYLEEAIASVEAQTYPAWELVLVDDGSTDGSSVIARRRAAADPSRIRYLEHPHHANLGMSASRNLGANAARGAYVTFLDADDVLRPEAIATLATRLEADPRVAMVYGPIEYWYDWPGSTVTHRHNFVQRLGVPANVLLEPPELLVRFLRRQAAAPSGMMVRAELFREVGGFEERFRGMYEDQAFCAKLCLSHAALATDVCGYRYRQHAASSSAIADRSGEADFGRTGFLTWLAEYLDAQSSVDLQVRRALRREQWWLRHPGLHRVARRARRLLRRFTSRAVAR